MQTTRHPLLEGITDDEYKKRFIFQTQANLLKYLIERCALSSNIAAIIVDFLPFQTQFLTIHPIHYDDVFSLIEFVVNLAINIVHYIIFILVFILCNNLYLGAIGTVICGLETIIISYFYKFKKRSINIDIMSIKQYIVNYYHQLYTIHEILVNAPILILLLINSNIYLFTSYFVFRAVFVLYQCIMYKRRKYINMKEIVKYHTNSMNYLLIESFIIFIYAIFINSVLYLIIAAAIFFIAMCVISKISTDHWFFLDHPVLDDHQVQWILILYYVQNICFGVFSMQIWFHYDEYNVIHVALCIATTIIQSLILFFIHFFRFYLIQHDGAYDKIYFLNDIFGAISILILSLYFMYNIYSNDNHIIWYANLAIIFIQAQLNATLDYDRYERAYSDEKSLIILKYTMLSYTIKVNTYFVWSIVWMTCSGPDDEDSNSLIPNASYGSILVTAVFYVFWCCCYFCLNDYCPCD